MELIAAQAILAFHKPTTASPFTAQLVSEGGISTVLKLVNFIILTPQLVDLRCVMSQRAHLIQLMELTKCDPDAGCLVTLDPACERAEPCLPHAILHPLTLHNTQRDAQAQHVSMPTAEICREYCTLSWLGPHKCLH